MTRQRSCSRITTATTGAAVTTTTSCRNKRILDWNKNDWQNPVCCDIKKCLLDWI